LAEAEGWAGIGVPDRCTVLLYRTSLCGCLLGAVATLYLLAGLVGFVGRPVPDVAAAAAVFLAAVYFLYLFFFQMLERSRWACALWSLLLATVLAVMILGLLPPTARDELTHHLALPRLYLKAGRILEVPFAPYSYYPMLLDMLYTPWVGWGWDFAPKLIHGLFGFLTALLLYSYLAGRLNALYGLLGAFVFLSTPAILRLSTWAYIDLGLVFYATASLLCLLRWLERGEGTRWLVLAGLSAGFALATKPNALLVLFVLLLLFLFALARQRGAGMQEATSRGFFLLLAALIPLSPWLVRNLFWTGNPLFPFFTALFGGAGADSAGVSVGPASALGILVKRDLLYGESPWEIAALPLRVFFSGRDDSAQYFDGVLNPILILFLPWSFKGKWVEEKKLLFAFALIYFLYALFLTDLRIRYLLPIVPPLVILLVYGIHNIYLRIARPPLLYAAVLFLLALNGHYLWSYVRTLAPLGYLSGRESRDSYLSRMLGEYPALQFINQNLPQSAKIYFLFVGRRVYYCERDYFHDTGESPDFLTQAIRAAGDDRGIKERLAAKGITHLLIRGDLFVRFLADNLGPQEVENWNRFGMRYLRQVFDRQGYGLYEIRQGA
jgi:4-amino-4-deoxy-L-arabinose transferase-like glycosyltransferase